ncbi:MAG: 30S ribosomal protein S7 [Patescibacteria group bacterium]|nr:30S ribosomal protein S7 [Patescibacteria group bacterium]
MRAKQFPKRDIKPDPKFNNVIVAKFINQIMRRGKKSLAQNLVYKTFDIISEKEKTDPLEVFEKALKNVSPVLEVISRRIGGANYQIPIEVRGDRRMTLAMRWIIKAAQSKKGKQMPEKLASELILAAKKEGSAMSKKEEVHRMAESNRAFAHFGRS